MTTGRCVRYVLLLAAVLMQSGCYYMQAAQGQLEVLAKRESIESVIDDPDTPPELAERLRLVADARDFSIAELGLPDNKSYRSYSDLERDFVVWNVFAAPEFSLAPETWCFPVAGCVAYRGYFKKAAAEKEAARLAAQGNDVHVGGVTAYSTLGKLSDPVLNTMMRWDDIQLVSVLFHELAHQKLYVKGDTAFNESYATAVEEFGIERFLAARGESETFENYQARKELRKRLIALVGAARDDLEIYYSETIDDDEKRLLKEHRIERLVADLRQLFEEEGRSADAWLSEPFNNARIISMVLYDGRVPAFRQLLADCDNELECFYDSAEQLAELDKAERDAKLDGLMPGIDST
ncbi:MAG: aminopeptidase [Woeseiaceae bacterium]|nr:aminopeptidase [Woeseiaceae bacterium]